MTNEEILKIAKEKYPVGTKVKCLTGHEIETLNGKIHWVGSKLLCASKENPYNNFIRIYMNNNWAEIISTPFKTYELW